MNRPVILAVDDDPQVLSAIERDLRQHYQANYRTVRASSGPQALEAVRQLKQRGAPIALFLVDERMPEMTGTQFLIEALKLYPDARRVLLTAYADTETAITAINRIGLDYYLLKPWEPPTQRLYPVLDELLADWTARAQPSYDGIRVAGTALSASSYVVREFLSTNQVPYRWVDLDQDASTRELIQAQPDGLSKLPVVFFPDGTQLARPDHRQLAEKLGMQTKAQRPFYDLLVVGGGPAGLAAAVYAGSEGLRTILVERRAPGGQAGTSSMIENYLGFPSGISGGDLARRAATQARRFGVEILTAQDVVSVRREDPYRIATLADGTELSSYVLLVASGMEVRTLDVPGAESLSGVGVYYGAALSEATSYRGQDVFVVGGANSAGQGALFFSRYARTVTMVVRAESLGASMSQYLVDRIGETPNIRVMSRTSVTAAHGTERLEALTIRHEADGTEEQVPAAAVFVFIGTMPRTDIVSDLVLRDNQGFILTGNDLDASQRTAARWPLERQPYFYETSVPGIFAAGDVRHGSGKRVAAAVGEGSATVSMVHQYLRTV
ncbi:MAG: FAD-dependent oxidoreductase [Gemmatimonadaceae bacterium]